MNIGIFTDTYYPQINGVVTSVRMLERELSKRGHRVYIFTTTDPRSGSAHPRVFRLPSMPFIFLPTHRMTFMYSPKLILKMKKFKLDIVHTQTEFPVGIFGKLVSDFFRLPCVHTYHTMYEDYVHYIANGHLITPKMAQKFSRIFCNRADVVISPVDKAKESLLEYGVIRPIRVIPTGLNFEPFSRGKYSQEEIDETKISLGLNPTDPVVVFVGRIAKEKSVDVILNAMPELLEKVPRAKFLVVGDGPSRESLVERARCIGVQDAVVFAGAQPWDTIGKYYQMGDVFVSASTSETQGLTYLEAMAAKVLVVAKKDRSVEDIIHDGINGYYFEDSNELPAILAKALTDKELSGQIAQNGFDSIQHLSSEKFAKSVEDLYLEMLGAHNAARKPRFRIRLKKID